MSGRRQVDVEAVAPRAAPSMARLGWPRRLTGWLAAVLADDGMNERLASERRRDEDVVRRIERSRRCR